MNKQSITIRSIDGAQLNARVFSADDRDAGDSSPVCLVLPAMGVRARFYEPLARELARRGYPAITADLRGQGESSERAARGSRFGYSEIVKLDLPAAAAALRRRFSARPLLIVAHSLGGQLATAAIGLSLVRPQGLVLIAAGTAHWRDWPRGKRARAGLAVSGIALAARLLPWYPGRRLGFGGDQPSRLMRDWSHNARTGRYRSVAEGRSLEPRPSPVSCPVLSVSIPGDLVAPPGATESLLRRFDPTCVSRVQLTPERGEGRWRRHFSLVRSPEAVVDSIRAWHDRSTLSGALALDAS